MCIRWLASQFPSIALTKSLANCFSLGVKVVSHGQDRYDRTIGEIYHDGTQINGSLVAAGLAWHYMKYAPDNTVLREAEQQAREMNNGLWSSAHGAIPPCDWRKMSKDEQDLYRSAKTTIFSCTGDPEDLAC